MKILKGTYRDWQYKLLVSEVRHYRRETLCELWRNETKFQWEVVEPLEHPDLDPYTKEMFDYLINFAEDA